MRAIHKNGNGTYELQKAHENTLTTGQNADARWRLFRRHKPALMEQLLCEQYGLCAYSEIRADLEGLDYHIEHIKPKSRFPAETFLFGHLVTSALADSDLKTLPAAEVFGGHAKLSTYDSALVVSCLDPDCPRFFAYLSDGRVEPAFELDSADRNRAIYTRDLLNLNSPFLVNRRRRWWDELDNLLQQHIEEDQSIYDLAAIDLLPTSGQLSPFFTLTRQFFSGIAEQVLRDGAPELL